MSGSTEVILWRIVQLKKKLVELSGVVKDIRSIKQPEDEEQEEKLEAKVEEFDFEEPEALVVEPSLIEELVLLTHVKELGPEKEAEQGKFEGTNLNIEENAARKQQKKLKNFELPCSYWMEESFNYSYNWFAMFICFKRCFWTRYHLLSSPILLQSKINYMDSQFLQI